jgi:hypothetical protein
MNDNNGSSDTDGYMTHDFHLELFDPPPDVPPKRRHYQCRASCPCGWESKVCRNWGQANRAWQKHRREPEVR